MRKAVQREQEAAVGIVYEVSTPVAVSEGWRTAFGTCAEAAAALPRADAAVQRVERLVDEATQNLATVSEGSTTRAG